MAKVMVHKDMTICIKSKTGIFKVNFKEPCENALDLAEQFRTLSNYLKSANNKKTGLQDMQLYFIME